MPGSGLRVSTVRGQDGRTIAAIVHDEALCDQPQLLEAGLAMAEVALKNQRLAVDAEAAMREVRASRARIAAGAERERRRIEQDLHDGAQQRLVALRIELELAEEVVRSDPEGGARLLQKLEQELDQALEELRALAHGVYPPLLADRGLVAALRAAAGRSPLPVRVDARAIGRYAPEVESAVYFCVLEALQNVLKHARRRRARLDRPRRRRAERAAAQRARRRRGRIASGPARRGGHREHARPPRRARRRARRDVGSGAGNGRARPGAGPLRP